MHARRESFVGEPIKEKNWSTLKYRRIFWAKVVGRPCKELQYFFSVILDVCLKTVEGKKCDMLDI